ncbi:MAG: hypothetical protein Q9216_004952 [Gyalolechia sp. 2 TL-2023]
MLGNSTSNEAQNVMGNASSQPSPPSPGIRRSGQKRKSSQLANGKRRRHSDRIEHRDGDGEGTQVSTYLKESRPRTPESLQDDAAASAQLIAESSPIAPAPASRNLDAVSSRHLPRSMKQGEKSRKRRSSVLQPSPDAGNVQARLKSFSPDGPLKLDNVASLDGMVEHGLETPNPTCSLDDIDENEEGLSSLFKAYETETTQHTSPVSRSPIQNANHLLLLNHDAIDPALINQSFKKKRKGKRKRQSSSSVLGAGAEQEHLSGTGQHAFDIDFDAFDELFADEGMQLANPFNEKSGHDLPNGTEPFGKRLPLGRAEAESPSFQDGDLTQEDQQTGLLPGTASARRPHKRKRTEVPNLPESQTPAYLCSYPPNAGQQDKVLPGIEDIQAGSSSGISSSHPPAPRDGGNRSPSPDQTPPPPLEKPSKPRGNKKQRGGKKGKDYNPPLREISEKGGMFSDKEIRVLDSFRDRYCEENNESHVRFNELIQSNVRGNPEVTRLFLAIHDTMPYRTRQSVMRFCRRHFHNFAARGVWSEADDIALKDAVAKKGNSWKAVGAMIDRFPEDCRDRYRNYLINADKRHTELWVPEEIRSLVRAVDFCMQLLREQRLRSKEEKYEGRDMPESATESDQDVQDMKLINWQVVSDRMGGTRSRLQCSYKWNHLKNADRQGYLREIRRLEKGKGTKTTGTSSSWRLRRAMKKMKNIKSGDKYDILQAFADCGAVTENDIPWTSLGSKEFRERWSAMDMKAALTLFKGQVPGSDKMSYQELVNRLYTRLMADDPGGFEDRWDPGLDGDVNKQKRSGTRKEQDEQNRALRKGSKRERVQADEARRLRLKRKSGEKAKIKSTLFVGSDDEEESQEDRNGASKERDEGEGGMSSSNAEEIVEEQTQSRESRASHEGRISDNEKDYCSSNVPSIPTHEDDDDGVPDASPCPVRARVSPSRTKGDETSSDESDDSLFNEEEGVGSELVDQLQLLRGA